MHKIHLDTDIGGDIDDLCALAMLLAIPDVEITGITTVADEQGRRCGYTKYVLRVVGREDIPVAAGADVSSGRFRYIPGYPPENEMWPETILPSPNHVDEALALLKQSIEQGAAIVAIGPFTNLYLLDQKYPDILRGVHMYCMGGYINPPRQGYPQWDNDMDYNLQMDTIAAQYLIERYTPTLIPLTITVETALRRAYLDKLRNAGPLGTLIARQAVAYNREWLNDEKIGETCPALPRDILNFQHDPLACAVALGWQGVTIENVSLSTFIEDGWLYEKRDASGHFVPIVTAVDGEEFNTFWLDTVTNYL